jgi:hypothetical protein
MKSTVSFQALLQRFFTDRLMLPRFTWMPIWNSKRRSSPKSGLTTAWPGAIGPAVSSRRFWQAHRRGGTQ